MTSGPARALVFVVLLACGCTRNPYVIGSICPTTGSDAGADPRCATAPARTTLVLGFDSSGTTALGPLHVGGRDLAPSLRLRGERATVAGWPTEGGAVLGPGGGVPTPGLGAPFTDGTAAVGLPGDAPAFVAPDDTTGAVGVDDFALEVVLRGSNGASVVDKHAGATGWWLHQSPGGQLLLELGDGVAEHAVTISSDPLTPGAWYHCLFWVNRGSQGRVDCNGQEGVAVSLPALGSLDVASPLTTGGSAPSRVAFVALFPVASGGLGAFSGWTDVSRTRFAELTGVYPSVAGGGRLPSLGLRSSEAYLDLQATAAAPRQLYLVGDEWPRVACRFDAQGAHVCGYLSEPARSQAVPSAASSWQAAGITVAPSTTPFADGEPRLSALSASTTSGPHALSVTATAGGRQVFSFFVHRLTSDRVGASAGGLGTAVFDLANGTVSSAPAGVRATIEPWGNDLYRCAYRFSSPGGATTYAVHLLDATGNDTFAGTGGAMLEIAGLQVDVGLSDPGSLLASAIQPADRLTFAGDDGNLPAANAVLAKVSVMPPAGPLVNDQAILNINLDGSFEHQVQVYLRGDNSRVKFWALNGQVASWQFDSDKQITDGARHSLLASWDNGTARLVVDDVASMAGIVNAPAGTLNRIDVGFSEMSSGAFEGLISGLQIGAP